MYIVFPKEYSAMAEATLVQAHQQYPRTLRPPLEEGLSEHVGPDTIVVTVYDMDAEKENSDVADFRWGILRAMSQGAVFVNYDEKQIKEAHFFNTDDALSVEDQINSILVAAQYSETRSEYYHGEAPKALYAGPTYVAPLAVVVTSYDSKKEKFSVDYDAKMRAVLASLPEDLWTKVGFVSARMSASLHKLLDVFPESAIVTFDKKPAGKVESYQNVQLKAPKKIERDFGIEFRNTVKRKEVREEE